MCHTSTYKQACGRGHFYMHMHVCIYMWMYVCAFMSIYLSVCVWQQRLIVILNTLPCTQSGRLRSTGYHSNRMGISPNRSYCCVYSFVHLHTHTSAHAYLLIVSVSARSLVRAFVCILLCRSFAALTHGMENFASK